MLYSLIKKISLSSASVLFMVLILVGGAVQNTAANALDAPQKQAVEGIIKDYLIKNPEIIQEALGELDKRQKEAQATAQKVALKSEKSSLVDGAVVGNPKGDVTIVEFFDYNCGFCKRALTDLQEFLKTETKVKIILKDFPVLGADSLEVSKVALAVKNQISGDAYMAFHAKLMGLSGRITKERALEVVKAQGLDVAKVEKDMQAPAILKTLEETVALGDRLGLTGTPAYVIGEEVVFGAVGAETLKKIVTNTRQCGKASC
jgi:protein-disulfide isomerase